jgi:hypothetical protein
MAVQITKQAALADGDVLDAAAGMVMAKAASYSLPAEVAQKFALQCDMLSDHFAKAAGIDVKKLAAERAKQALTGDDVHNEGAHGEDPEQIGVEKSGPLEQETDEPYMKGEFTQQENRELREKVQGDELGPDKISPEPQAPKPGVQAALANGTKLAALYLDINKAATKCAGSDHEGTKALGTKLANAGVEVLQFQSRLLQGSETEGRVASLTVAAAHVLPHFAADVPPAAVEKLGQMTDIFAGLAKSA